MEKAPLPIVELEQGAGGVTISCDGIEHCGAHLKVESVAASVAAPV